MPELPEVEILRQYFEEAALHKEIADTGYYDDSNKIFKSSRQEIGSNLIGNKFTETYRVGKYLFAKLSNGRWLHLHFGMTGSLEILSSQSALSKYTRFKIVFKNGETLAFRDLRKFGTVAIVGDPEEYRGENGVGQDLLKIQESDFTKALSGRKTALKNALLNQKYFAGIGNWMADEMLFETSIHPETQPAKLTKKELKSLYRAGISIATKAIEHDTHRGDFPENFLANYRMKGAVHPDHPHSPVEPLKVGGRGTFIIPEKQKQK